MNKKTLSLLSVLIFFIQAIFCEGQFESRFVQRHYAFSCFDSLLISGPLRVRVLESENWDVFISCSREDLNFIKLRKNNNIFEISRTSDSLSISSSPVIIISMPKLIAVSLSGIVQMEAGGFSSDENLDVSMGPGTFLNLSGFESSQATFALNGSCELHAFMSALMIEINSSGSSLVRMGGRAEHLTITAGGRGKFDGSLLFADYVELELTGLSEVRITPDIQMRITSTDKALVYYNDKYMEDQPISVGNAILRKF